MIDKMNENNKNKCFFKQKIYNIFIVITKIKNILCKINKNAKIKKE